MANLIILWLLTTVYAVFSICCFSEHRHRSGSDSNAVWLPDYLLWVGWLGGGFFLVIAWFAVNSDGNLVLTLCFGGFVLLALLLMLGWKNCCITYDHDSFTQYNLIGMQRSFRFDQVTGYSLNKRNSMESVLYVNETKIAFNLTSPKGADFLLKASSEYKKAHRNQSIPQQAGLKKERGGFCAHVYNPGEYLAIFIMLLAFILGTGGWIAADCLIPVSESESVHHTVAFTSLQIDEDSIILLTPQMEEAFVIHGFQGDASGIQSLRDACDGSRAFSVWGKRFDPDDSAPYFQVYALSSGTAVYHTFEDTTAYRRESLPGILCFFGIFLVIFLAFSGFVYIVGSQPEKFPKWVVYSCFQKNAICID